MIRLIAVDLDGTLLPDNHVIPERVKDLIKEMVDKGIYFVIASGRPYKSAKRIQKELGIDQPMILHNGTILKTEKGTLSFCREIPQEVCAAVFQYCSWKHYNCSIIYGDCDRIIVNYHYDFTFSIHRNIHFTEPELSDALESSDLAVTKILVADQDENRLDGIYHDLKGMFGSKINVMKSGNWYIDLVPLETSKGTGLQIISERLGISKDEIMAIGDSYNDLDMLDFSGYPVAMENAEDCVKDHAAYVTSSNNEEGVYEAIKKIFNR